MRRLQTLSVLVALFASACDSEETGTTKGGFLLTDSAGISIAFSTDSSWSGTDRWTVAPDPVVMIGSVDGDDPHTAFGRVGGVEVLSDGRIVVADGLAQEIRVFDRDGAFLTTLGGRGEGPAEFGRLDRIAALTGDSVVGRDVAAFKHVIFASDGSGSRTVTGPSMSWRGLIPVYVSGWLSDGSALVSHTIQRDEYPSGTGVVSPEWHLLDPLGEYRAFIGNLPQSRVNNVGEGAGPLAFSLTARIQADSSGFWHALPEEIELVHHTATGIDRIVRTGFQSPLVTQKLRDSYRIWFEEVSRDRAEGVPPSLRSLVEARVDELTFSERVPAFRSFRLSKDGFFWLQNYETVEEMTASGWSWDERPPVRDWTVLSPEGRWLGTVELPAGLSLRVVTEDRIVGVLKDEMDVDFVVAYELRKHDSES